ncbi:MAG: HTTM domain-containing protein [Planctomycetaceae bacterium]|nr:HTTM domain-containing protein [Planctomycetaceae bacterium]
MSMIRILVGWMSFYTVLVWGMRLDSMFNVDGLNSMEMINNHLLRFEGPFAQSFWYYVPVEWVYPVHYLCLAITFCVMIGLFTRVTSVLSLMILVSYAYRARYANYGLDQINAILMLYVCLANSGAYLSVDRWLKSLRTGKSMLDPVKPGVATNIAMRMTQLHYCVIYMAAGLGKLQGDTWWDGSAMWRGLANAEYQTLDMTWLAYFPWVTEFITHLTIAWEVSFAFLIWRPLARPWMLLLGTGMHLSIGLMLGMWTFGTCMTFGYLAFLSPYFLRSLFQRLAGYTPALAGNADQQIVSAAPPLVSETRNSPRAMRCEHVILLDKTVESAHKTTAEFVKRNLETTLVQTLDELLDQLEQDPNAGVVVNLQKLSDADVETYFTSLLPMNLSDRPSVTLLRNRHTVWLDRVSLPDYQRILLLPCDRIDLISELEHAFMFVNELATDHSSLANRV